MKTVFFFLSAIFFTTWSSAQSFNATDINNLKTDTLLPFLPFDTVRVRLGQSLGNRASAADTARDIPKATLESPNKKQLSFKNTLCYDFYATAGAIQYINPPEDFEKSSLNFYYNININNTLKIGKVSWNFLLFNEYGYKQYIDSIGIKNEDLYNFRTRIQLDVKDNIKLNINYAAKSQLWKQYSYMPDDSDRVIKSLYTDYFSPGYFIYSAGLAYVTASNISFELGLAGGKTTKIKNQEIFETREVKKLYGVEKGNSKNVEYGVNLLINAPILQITKNLYWETNSVFFVNNKNWKNIDLYTFDVNNAFHYVFLKHFRLTLRTKILYDIEVQNRVFTTNQLTIGFYLSNKLK